MADVNSMQCNNMIEFRKVPEILEPRPRGTEPFERALLTAEDHKIETAIVQKVLMRSQWDQYEREVKRRFAENVNDIPRRNSLRFMNHYALAAEEVIAENKEKQRKS